MLNPTEVKRRRGAWLLCLALILGTAGRGDAQAAGGHAPPPQSSPPQQQSEEARSAQDAATLELSKPVEREISGGRSHIYQITLTKGQHIRLEIRPQNIDLGVAIQLPGGKSIAVYDPLGVKQEQLVIEHVAAASGIYQFKIFTSAKAPAGRYEIRVAALREATENDYALQQARDLFAESHRLTRESKFMEARPLILRALEIRERVSGPDDLKVADLVENLAITYQLTGDYAGAEPLQLRVLKIFEKVYGPEHPAVADALRELGVLYYQKGDYFKAEESLQKALILF